jgi:glyoxylase-like metal-dependent hydrolase (beta-lactamase superfamily II)
MLTRRHLLTSAAAAASLPLLPAPGLAKVAKATAQAPGVYRMSVGDIQVTAILDGHLDLGPELFAGEGADIKAINDLLAMSPQKKPLRAPINTYVVNVGDRAVLIDTGAAKMAPTTGSLAANLQAAGIAPDAIDAILLTHMHGDHVNGMLTADGKAAFPNAELIVAEAEWNFWTPAEALAKAPEGMKPFFQMAQASVVPYGSKVTKHSGEKEVVKGVTALPAPGHTPGHTAYRISSGSSQLLVWGDLVHAAALQFAHPEWTLAFDVDRPTAAATRKKIFDMVAADRIPVVGMHMPFPGHGYVVKSANAYGFATAMWDPEL